METLEDKVLADLRLDFRIDTQRFLEAPFCFAVFIHQNPKERLSEEPSDLEHEAAAWSRLNQAFDDAIAEVKAGFPTVDAVAGFEARARRIGSPLVHVARTRAGLIAGLGKARSSGNDSYVLRAIEPIVIVESFLDRR